MDNEPYILKVIFDDIPDDIKYKIVFSLNTLLISLLLVNGLLFAEFFKIHYILGCKIYNNIRNRIYGYATHLP